MSNGNIVQIDGLTKKFGKTTAIDDLNMTVGRGRIVGLLGANGAGKSTLLRHIIGFYLPTAGKCSAFGVDCGKLTPKELSRIGYVHQNGELVEWMKVKQLIKYVKAYYDNWNEDIEKRFVEEFELDLNKRVAALSPGQKQRLAILLAICFEPELLILDEPAAGLDPIARMQFLELLLEIIQDTTRTIVISSHILSDVEKVIDHAVIMKKGKVLRDCGFDELLEEYCRLQISGAGEQDLPQAAIKDKALEYESSGNMISAVMKAADVEKICNSPETQNLQTKTIPLSLEHIFKIIAR
ncbi:MAG: ABC transporter ATP-binding protein [Sedimentisphaeraceae bacterium JB056]